MKETFEAFNWLAFFLLAMNEAPMYEKGRQFEKDVIVSKPTLSIKSAYNVLKSGFGISIKYIIPKCEKDASYYVSIRQSDSGKVYATFSHYGDRVYLSENQTRSFLHRHFLS